jgi:adenylate cyclase
VSALRITIHSGGQDETYTHDGGPLEIGRGHEREYPRIVVTDPSVSRDHLRITAQRDGSLLVENLSISSDVFPDRGGALGLGDQQVIPLPATISIGHTNVDVDVVEPSEDEFRAEPYAPTIAAGYDALLPTDALPAEAAKVPGLAEGLETIAGPVGVDRLARPLRELGEAPDAATLARWFETLVTVQQAAATSEQFLEATAHAVVDLVGLDTGLVLLRDGESWSVAARAASEGRQPSARYSSTILNEVVRHSRTIYRNLGAEAATASLVGVETVVAAPVFDSTQEVMGAVYGSRALRAGLPSPDITDLEARVVQVLAAAAGAGLAREREREGALRARFTFEQFFSAELARQLVEDPSLLEGRDREVTLLFSDVRNFSRISERLGPVRTFEMMQDIMDLQTTHIRDTQGVVVDYVGDGLLAMWNAPADTPDHPWLACLAGQRIAAGLPSLSARWEALAGEPIRLGIGINTGPALVGNTGSSIKFKYGPMGPTVNLASRVENATKSVGIGLLITRSTRDRLSRDAGTRRIGGLRLQGIADPVDVFELAPGVPDAGWCERRDAFEHALFLFETRQWPEACRELVALVIAGDEYDMPALQLLSRAVECMRSNPPVFDPALSVEKAI